MRAVRNAAGTASRPSVPHSDHCTRGGRHRDAPAADLRDHRERSDRDRRSAREQLGARVRDSGKRENGVSTPGTPRRRLLRARKSSDPIADWENSDRGCNLPVLEAAELVEQQRLALLGRKLLIDRSRARNSSPAISAASASGASSIRPFRPCSASGSRMCAGIRS